MKDEGCLYCRGKVPPVGASCKHCGRKGAPIPHVCHAQGCSVQVPPKMLMCKRHWSMVPRSIQREVWDRYVPGQEIKKNPTSEYLEVMKRAINAVAEKENRPLPFPTS